MGGKAVEPAGREPVARLFAKQRTGVLFLFEMARIIEKYSARATRKEVCYAEMPALSEAVPFVCTNSLSHPTQPNNVLCLLFFCSLLSKVMPLTLLPLVV